MVLTAEPSRGGDALDQYYLACAKYFLALARFDMGHKFQARRLLDEANRAANDGQPVSFFSDWQRQVILETLRREATTRIAR
jgi:hypothetical protein